jgi:tRNA threonylcarbamoyladenosine biosynthesis protein TsaB
VKLLAIETSGQTVSAAVVDEYIVLGEFSAAAKSRHVELLLPIIDKLFAFTGFGIEDMDAVACVCGPGSFTGLRIGAAAAMGLVKGAGGKGLLPVPTLDALAYNVGSAAGSFYIMPMLDARRGQVYTALYRADNNGLPRRISEYQAVPVEEALAFEKDRPVLFLGDGADQYKTDILKSCPAAVFASANMNRQRAASAGVCAVQMLQNGFVPTSEINLMYIRKPQAEREMV